MKSRGIGANFGFNVAGAFVPIAVSLITVPIYMAYIGEARYGVLSIVWVLLGYFGFLDLGLSRASANALAKLQTSSSEERSQVLITAFCLNFFLGLSGGVILFFLGGYVVEHLLAMPEELKPEIAAAFLWIAALLPLGLVSGVGIGALEARERFLVANVLGGAGAVLGQVAPVLCAILIEPTLSVVITAAALSRCIFVLAVLAFVLRQEWPVTVKSFDRKQGRKLFSYGGWVSITNVISPLLTSLDQLVIGSVLGVVAVAHYAVPMNLVSRSQIFAGALSRTLFPRMSRVEGSEAKELAETAVATLACGFGAICVAAIFMARPFMELWMGADFSAVAAPIAELLLIGAWVNGLAFIPFAFLQARGRPDIVAKFHALEVAPFVAVLWFFTVEFGLVGAAIAWVLRVTVDAGLLLGAVAFGTRQFLKLGPAFLCVLGAYFTNRLLEPSFLNSVLLASLGGAIVMSFTLIVHANAREFLVLVLSPKRTQKH